MSVVIRSAIELPTDVSPLFLSAEIALLKDFQVSEKELNYMEKKRTKETSGGFFMINRLDQILGLLMPDHSDTPFDQMETLRRQGVQVAQQLKEEGLTKVALMDLMDAPDLVLALAEGVALASYSFDKYKSDKKEAVDLEILVVSPGLSGCQIAAMNRVVEAVFIARDLVNEPVGFLNAERLGQTVLDLSKAYGFTAEVFNKKKIEALKMGGLLAVNQGSIDPPTFSVMEWKPDNARNAQPIVLVGKGVVYDTGGINLKTPAGSLDTMKCDMGGAASVIGAMVAVAANEWPIHVIGLVPATDNRPGGNAIVPGDIITMHSGTTVEIINTDAEGRLILADALSFAKRYQPELVIDLATLTGNAVVAIGSHGTVGMGTASEEVKAALGQAGDSVCERVVWFPFWKDYDDEVKSEIADIKNLGSREGGAISAGKFLSKFVEAPWLHLDIAGPAFLERKAHYRGIGGTGVGVRMLARFMEGIAGSSKGNQ
ncbi:leucyl aminopeptidase family protein [Geofilum rubicundum]|uniref:Cytosol aminopeptidase PepA n=1 Tax=Geofilum rubicundum JCM 15548 TaxID=1236989 RepID=A0A0E9LS79_9BACT|nr:leucyl aminopeptidase [Geofilum rubicundum]GAO27996.1 cytosol aminopeptidase PepA [Geofilum rubicundum JCM 15548]